MLEKYTRQHSPKAAARIGARLRQRIGDLEPFPEQAKPRGSRGLRELIVSGTPYIVLYRVTEEVEIVTILHHARKRRS